MNAGGRAVRGTAADEALGFAHRFVPAEPGAGRSAPTLLLLHGTGGSEDDLLPLGRMLAPGAALLSPRGKVLENGMPRFFRRLAEGVFDVPDLVARTHELAAFVRAAAERYGFDPHRVVAVGFSNGANIAAGLLLLHAGLLRAAALLRPMVPFDPDPVPDLAGTSVFVGAGRHDPLVPPQNTERLVELLRSAGADVTAEWQPTGHNLTEADVEAARRWLAGLELGKTA
jgi:phospholipase/carboxylesterase/glyoxalase family protein